MDNDSATRDGRREPVFNMPPSVIGLIGLLTVIFAASTLVLDARGQFDFAVWFGFLPFRLIAAESIPGGLLPLIWTPLTHAFLHAGWEHLALNVAWLAIFGTPVARRYGTARFLIAFFGGAIFGALAFAFTSHGDLQVLIGASGGVAGLTGVAIRFIFQPVLATRDPETGEVILLGRKQASLGEMFRERRALAFFVFWVGINGLMPLLPALTGMEDVLIAWQAHLGGFFFGLLVAPLFERRSPAAPQR